ncbi:TonB-dependent receptor [Marinobacterium sediminicola]
MFGVGCLLPLASALAEEPVLVLVTNGHSPPVSTSHSPDRFMQTSHQLSVPDPGLSSIEDWSYRVPAVQPSRLGAGTGSDIMIRGFSSGGRLLLDGMLDNQHYFVRDPATIESIEIIKGHNSVLYGSGAPGGSLNYRLAKPHFEHRRTVWAGAGDYGTYQAGLDIESPVTNRYAFRNILSWQASKGWKANTEDQGLAWLTSHAWQPGDRTLLRFDWEFSRQTYPYDFDNVYANGSPVYGSSYVHPASRADRHYHRLELFAEQQLTDRDQLEFSLRHIRGRRDERQIGFYYMINDQLPLMGFDQQVDDRFRQTTGRIQYARILSFGSLKAGFDWHQTDNAYDNRRQIAGFWLDIYNPDMSFAPGDPATYQRRPGGHDWREQALFIKQDVQVSQRLTLAAGWRRSRYRLNSWLDPVYRTSAQGLHDSLAVGLAYQLSPSTRLLGSYSQSWLPNAGTDRNGEGFDSSRGEQLELGINTELGRGKSLNLSLFNIVQSDVLVRDPDDPAYRMTAGAKQVRGLELTLHYPLTRQLDLSLSAGLLDAVLSRTGDAYEGNDFPGVPKRTASLILDYRPVTDVQLQASVLYQGKRPGDRANGFYVDAFTRLDLAASWQLSRDTRLMASIENVTDEQYVNYVAAADFVRFGAPRNLMLGLRHHW